MDHNILLIEGTFLITLAIALNMAEKINYSNPQRASFPLRMLGNNKADAVAN